VIRASAYTLVVLVVSFLLAGCDGTAGPDGNDSPPVDTVAPELELIQPSVGAVITESTMILEAMVYATPEIGIDDLQSVRFLVNGSSVVDGDSAVVTEAPYLFEWDFDLAGTSFGTVMITAESMDTLGNTNRTASRVITRYELAGVDTLTDRFGPGKMDDLIIPQLLITEEGDEKDTVRVTQIGTRFEPYGACVLNQIRLFPVLRADINYQETANYWVGISTSSDGISPGTPLDSFYVEADPFQLDRWQVYDLETDIDITPPTFAAGESFFITIRPDVADPDSMDAGLRIGTLLEADSTETPDLEAAYWYERHPAGNGWTPVSMRHAEGYVHHLFVDAVIEYLPEGEE
jgi:predicted small secreted protein